MPAERVNSELVMSLVERALARPAEERHSWVSNECHGDPALLEQVLHYLRGEELMKGFLLSPLIKRDDSETNSTAAATTPGSGPALTSGTVLAQRYRIVNLLGRGGMGEVYRADDLLLELDVAIKFLPLAAIPDNEAIRRLRNEVRIARQVTHPNVCRVYDIGEAEGLTFLTMEYVDGEDLASLLRRIGKFSTEKGLEVARKLCAGLAAAHEKGVIHRDLKPANIMLDGRGHVRIMDFGLAGLADQIRDARSGTPAYMSPEQRAGNNVTARSDIYALGLVLHEMFTGRRPSQEKSGTQLDVAVERVIERCLETDPRKRPPTALSVAAALPGDESVPGTSKKIRLLIGTACALALIMVAGIWLYLHSGSPQPEARVTPLTSYPGFQRDPAFSPDGNEVAFAWTGGSGTVTHIYVKIIGTNTPLQLTSGDMMDVHPSWSPDGKSIAFLRAVSPAVMGIYQIGALGGPERRICEIAMGLYPALSWSRDARWLVTSGRRERGARSQIFAVSALSGQPRPLSFDGTDDEFYPALSPDSRFLAFSRRLGDSDWGIFVAPMDDNLQPKGPPHRLNTPYGLNGQSAWTVDGKDIIFATGSPVTLWRAAANSRNPARQLTMTGEAAYQPVIAQVGGRLAYAHDFNNVNVWRVAVPATGKAGPAAPILSSARSSWVRPNSISPDGRRIAFESNRSGFYGIWIANADGSDPAFLFGSADYLSGSPAWSPDGRWIAFDTRKDKTVEVYVISADGGAARRVTNNQADSLVPCWSHDGKWIYFSSDRTGRFEVFKISPQGGDAIQLTHNGGWGPQESPDGKFLFYTHARAAATPLFKVSTTGGPESQILPTIHERWWAVGDKGVWFMESAKPKFDPGVWSVENAPPERGSLRFLSFSDGTVRAIGDIAKGPVAGLAVSGEQGALVFNQVDHLASEILLVENFR